MYHLNVHSLDFDTLDELKNHLSDEPLVLHNFNIDDVLDLIEALGRIPVTSTLVVSGFENSKYQLKIDELTLNAKYQALMNQDNLPLLPAIHEDRPKRYRQMPKSAAVTLDTAVEQVVVVEQEVQQELDLAQEVLVAPKKLLQVDLDDFVLLCYTHSPKPMSIIDMIQLWCRVNAGIYLDNYQGVIYDLAEDDLPQSYLSHADNLFNSDYYSVTIHPDSRPHQLSFDAAKFIASHPEQFGYGLDLEHLPRGFALVPHPKYPDNKTIHYEKHADKHGTELSLTVPEKSLPKKIAPAVFAKLMALDINQNRKIRLLAIHQQFLENESYNPSDLQAFYQHIPYLIGLSDEGFAALLALSSDDRIVNSEKLNYLIHNHQHLLSLSRRSMLSKSSTTKQFKDFDLDNLKTYALDAELMQSKDTSHAGILLLDKHTQDFINTLNEIYSFSWQQLQQFFIIYQTEGQHALALILNELQHVANTYETRQNRLSDFYAFVDFKNLPKEKIRQEVIRNLIAMGDEEYLWWNTLLTEHMMHSSTDNPFNLFLQFGYFSSQIKEMGLAFYQPVGFKNIRSLPVALSRMIRILKHCRESDLALQWQCLTELPLQSNGAILAIEQAKKNRPCHFVTPSMKTEGRYYSPSMNGLFLKKYQCAKDISLSKNIYLNDHQDQESMVTNQGLLNLKLQFWRLVAHTPNTASLDFYQKAEKVIFDAKLTSLSSQKGSFISILQSAYIILAGGSMGVNAPQCPEDETKMLQEFKNVIDFLRELPALPPILRTLKFDTAIRSVVMENIGRLKFQPPFNNLHVILQGYQSIWSSITVSNIALHPLKFCYTIIETSLSNAMLLEASSQEELIAIFNSFRFKSICSVDDSLKHYDDLLALGCHLNNEPYVKEKIRVQEAVNHYNRLNELFYDENIRLPFFALMSLYSTFNLDKENLVTINRNLVKSQTAIYALNLLAKVSKNDGLTVLRLNRFLEALPQDKQPVIEDGTSVIDYEAVHECLKRHFKDYFAESFFDNLNAHPVDGSVVRIIENNMPWKHLLKPTTLFIGRFPKHVHKPCITSMLRLMKALGEAGQSWLHDLVVDDLFQIKNYQDLESLLRIYEKNNNPNHWQYLHHAIKRCHMSGEAARDMQAYWLDEFMPAMSGLSLQNDLPVDFYDMAFELKRLMVPIASDAWLVIAEGLKERQQAKEPLMNLLWKLTEQNQFKEENIRSLFAFINKKMDIEVMALCEWFADNRLDLMNQILSSLKDLSDESKEGLFRILQIQANINASLSARDMRALLNDDNLQRALPLYSKAPFPPVKKVNQWLNKADFTSDYEAFKQAPCQREAANGFDLSFARQQIGVFKPCLLNDNDLVQFNQDIFDSKSKSIDDLLIDLKNNELSLSCRVARAAELMYRTMGREGDSHEINTTQYLSVLSVLNGSNHVLGRAFAGEGKTRIFMLLAAITQAEGKTVVFATKNMPLARREFIDYQPFFDVLGASRALISAMSSPDQLSIGGIHFTEASHFERFLNRERADGRCPLVAIPEDERVLLLDEADQVIFDSYHMRYNVSYTKQRHLGDLTWIYPLLAEFFEDPKHVDAYTCIDDCNQFFKDFVHGRVSTQRWNQFSEVADSQIESWHRAMMEARGLVFGRHFNIHANEAMLLPGEGRQIFSRAVAVTDKREAPESTFALGVQQCLHALLNLRKVKGNQEPALQRALNRCTTPFILRPESQIVYSTNSASFLNSFKESTVIGLTGTAGNTRERLEAQRLYGFECLDIPRHNPLKRVDMPKRWCNSAKRQLKAIIEDIEFSQKMKQPVLLICEDDVEMKALYKKLKSHFGEEKLAQIGAEIKTRDELSYLDNEAGQPDKVTVSTDMLSRGANIKLHEASKAVGLCVLCTYLPSDREYEQIINRAGRYGAVGRSRLILDKNRCKRLMPKGRIRGTGLFNGFYDFYTHREGVHTALVDCLDKPKQQRRLVQTAMDNMILSLQDLCYSSMIELDKEQQNQRKSSFALFNNEASELRASCLMSLEDALSKAEACKSDVDDALLTFSDELRALWHEHFKDINVNHLSPSVIDCFDELQRHKSPRPMGKASFFHRYEKAHDGFSARYDHIFAQSRALLRGERAIFANTRAYIRGEGTVFANLKAWLRGEITLKQYLFPVARGHCLDVELVIQQPGIANNR